VPVTKATKSFHFVKKWIYLFSKQWRQFTCKSAI